jgi:hypothetical protein
VPRNRRANGAFCLFSDLEDTVRSLSRRLRGVPRHAIQIALPKLQLDRYCVAPDLLDKSSIVYSARASSSSVFEDALRQRFGCAVHSCEVSSFSTRASVIDRVQIMMRTLGHRHVDLLRLDLEGGEYSALEALARSALRPCQLIVEFHHDKPNLSIDHTERALTQLNEIGYRIFDCRPAGCEYSLAWV